MTIDEYLCTLRGSFGRGGCAERLVQEAAERLHDIRGQEVALGIDADQAEATHKFGRVDLVAEQTAAQARLSGGVVVLETRSSLGTATKRRRPRGPGLAYATLSLLLMVVIASIALISRQAPPPTIAEFAPQAVEQIRDSSADLGGSRGEASVETTALDGQNGANDAARQTINVARVRQCVGDPPRQIEDPQSPPCVPYWSGDNGGATSHGVTRDEIRVVVTNYDAGLHPALQAFFNKRFEFYGRQIRLISPSTASNTGTPAGDQAAARAHYEQDKAFASTGYAAWSTYDTELARVGIVGAISQPNFPETHLASLRPYLWTYPMANDRIFATAGNWFCARFAGRNAIHAGDPLLRATRRKPGIIMNYGSANASGISADPMNTELASCGEHAPVVEAPGVVDPVQAENVVLQMKTADVTTVTCLCEPVDFGLILRSATNQAYFPEWLVTTFIFTDRNGAVRAFAHAPEQLKSLMALRMQPMERPFADHPSNWATHEANNSQAPPNSYLQTGWDDRYEGMLLLASGIQMAGPRLTPATFEQGLHRTKFPNPAHPIMAGSVGFADGDHSMTDDAAEMWWSNTAQSPYGEGPGTFCYVEGGARRRIGTFPTDDPFFQGPCDNGTT